jgi:hypothetical protein
MVMERRLENVLEMFGDVWDHTIMQKKVGKMKGKAFRPCL